MQFCGGGGVLCNLPCPISCESLVFYILLTGVVLFYFQISSDSLGQPDRAVFVIRLLISVDLIKFRNCNPLSLVGFE